jgi:hypothetical protein
MRFTISATVTFDTCAPAFETVTRLFDRTKIVVWASSWRQAWSQVIGKRVAATGIASLGKDGTAIECVGDSVS